MNNMTSRQRKLVYLCGILVLLVPIIATGLPSDGSPGSGGRLAQLRSKYELGESDLGDVDPSSAAMNLVLLGMRGVAVNLLWVDLDKQRDMKRWAEMQAVTESIVRLQPHFEKVWEFNGGNLAYNTSAEWDAVPDRYYWVKEGGKFMRRGVERNRKSTFLQYHVGNIYQKKIGNADEAKDYRYFFQHDPDPKFVNPNDPTGPHTYDPEFNLKGDAGFDNYQMAKVIYLRATEMDNERVQHVMDKTLFHALPARCQFDYASGLQKDGKFEETTREAWAEALKDWMGEGFGSKTFRVPSGDDILDISFEATREVIERSAPSKDDAVKIARVAEQYRKIVNYHYWRMRGFCEAEKMTADAHRDLYEANQAYKKQNVELARQKAVSGLKGFEDVMRMPQYKDLKDEDTLVEECMLGVLVWMETYQLSGEKIPDEFPLKWLFQEKMGNEMVSSNVRRNFKRLFLD